MRLFVLTRDPLDWIPHHGAWWATVYANGDNVDELPVYVLLPEVLRRMELTEDAAAVLALFAQAAVRAAADLESVVVSGGYPTVAAGGAAPRLLDRVDETRVLGSPSVAPCSDRWEPMGLGAIQDLVREAFGPVDLDRSPVALAPIDEPDSACPACLGTRFGFPAELTEDPEPNVPRSRGRGKRADRHPPLPRPRKQPGGLASDRQGIGTYHGLPEPGGLPLPARSPADPGRNDLCPCGSGRKYKRCCGA